MPSNLHRTRGPVLVGGLIALLAFGAWLPHHRFVTEKRDRIESQQHTLRQLRLDASRTLAVEMPEDVPHTALGAEAGVDGLLALPDRTELGQFLEQLSEDLAAESALVQQLQANAIVQGDDFNRIPISLQFTGSYTALFGLLSRIESSPRVIRIDRIDVTGSPAATGEPLDVMIELSTFSLARKRAST